MDGGLRPPVQSSPPQQPFFTNVAEADRAQFLLMPQLTFWPGLTVLFGTAMASLGALLSGRRRAA